jgi:hypothetical protein
MSDVLIDGTVGVGAGRFGTRLIHQQTATDFIAYFAGGSPTGFGYKRSADALATWGSSVVISTTGVSSEQFIDAYKRRWNGAGESNVVDLFSHRDDGSRGLYHRQLNLDTMTLGSEHYVAAFGAAPFGSGGGGVAESGRIYIHGGGAGFQAAECWYSDNEGVSWTQFGAAFMETQYDTCILYPDFSTADPDDMVGVYLDQSAGEATLKFLDASSGTVTESAAFATGLTVGIDLFSQLYQNISASFASDGHLRIALFSTSGTPALIRTFDAYGATVTEKTNALASTANAHAVAIQVLDVDGVDWTVVHYTRDGAGASDGSCETYYRISIDDMVTWQTEQAYGTLASEWRSIHADPRPPSTDIAAGWVSAGGGFYTEIPIQEAEETAVTQYRLMLAEAAAPDIPTLNITALDITNGGDSLIRVERGRESAIIGNPARAGRGSFTLNNSTLAYNLDQPTPGLAVRLNKKYDGTWYHMWQGNVDVPEQEMQSNAFRAIVKIQANGSLTKLSGKKVSTALYESITTGAAINHLLDAADFPTSLRDIDVGDVTLPFWWASNEDALSALWKLVNSEGITADLYEQGDGKLVFRDRSARYDETRSNSIQTTFTMRSTEPRFTDFTYVSGWREIVNYATATLNARSNGVAPSVVWTDNTGSGSYILAPPGFPRNTLVLEAVSTEPFKSAITPVLNTDYAVGFGSVTVTLERTSGQRTKITFTGGAAGASIGPASGNDGIQLRATETTVNVSFSETSTVDASASITAYGLRPWQGEMWSDMYWYDMRDNLDAIVTWKKDPRGRIRFGLNAVRNGVASALSAANEATAKREIGDRVRVQYPDLDFDGECWIERIEHEVFAPAGAADGTSVGREFTWYECSVVSLAVGSQGSGVSNTTPYSAINNEAYVGAPLARQGMLQGTVAGVFFGAGP